MRGYIWKEGVYHCPLPDDLFPPNLGFSSFIELLKGIDGCFSVVLEREDSVLAAVDRIRSYPLFYAKLNGDLLVSGDANALLARLPNPQLDETVLPAYLMAGYTSGNATLYSDIRQLEAGQCLHWDKGNKALTLTDYYVYRHDYREHSEPLAEMDAMHGRIFQRLIESAQGRTIVVPLSGGYDSRLIAFMLRRLGYEKVICYTYGNATNGECITSQQVARQLGYPWHIIEHSRRDWYRAFHSSQMKEFFRYSTHLCSSLHIQDWLAVQQLRERKLIPDDSIIVPGHSGGSLQGANLPAVLGNKEYISRQELLDALYYKHFNQWQGSRDDRNRWFASFLDKALDIQPQMPAEEAAERFDLWDWRERQAKFIVNSIRVYEFFGYEWRLPLWDREFLDFWTRVPLEQRMERKLYRQYVHTYQNMSLKTYHDYPWRKRIVNRVIRLLFGFLYNPIYGRFEDIRKPLPYIRNSVAGVMVPELCYPEFVRPAAPLLRVNINGVQALYYLRFLFTGEI